MLGRGGVREFDTCPAILPRKFTEPTETIHGKVWRSIS
jgi:hypothetical protein